MFLTTSSPWKGSGETVYQVEESPSNDDTVVNIQEKDDGHGGIPNTCNAIIVKLIEKEKYNYYVRLRRREERRERTK